MADVTVTLDYSYLPCQFCVGKNHCAQCGEDIRQSLLGLAGVRRVEMDVPARKLILAVDEDRLDDVVDAADALGVFL